MQLSNRIRIHTNIYKVDFVRFDWNQIVQELKVWQELKDVVTVAPTDAE